MYPPKIPLANTSPNTTGIPSPSTQCFGVGASPVLILGALLLKKKGESYAIALPASFGGTNTPRAVLRLLATHYPLLATDSPGGVA